MLKILQNNWWLIALRGFLAVVFGGLTLIWPQITVLVLVFLFGAYTLVDGIFSAIVSIRDRAAHENWWVYMLEGLAGIAAGILAFVWPDITAQVFVYLIAIWAFLTGVIELIAAFALRREMQGELLLAFTGALSIVLGVILFAQPEMGAIAIAWLIGAYAILFGILLIFLAFRLRKYLKAFEAGAG